MNDQSQNEKRVLYNLMAIIQVAPVSTSTESGSVWLLIQGGGGGTSEQKRALMA